LLIELRLTSFFNRFLKRPLGEENALGTYLLLIVLILFFLGLLAAAIIFVILSN
jgi:hypothetical protein